MADTYSQSFYQGIGIHDENFSAANSDLTNLTQAGPEPDQPQATVRGFAELETTGTAVADAAKNVTTVKPGAPIGNNKGGRYAWKDDADGSTSYRGWLNYNKLTGWNNVKYVASGGGHTLPHAITLPDHSVIVAYHTSTGDLIETSTADPATDGWASSVEVVDLDSVGDGTSPGHPSLVRLPDSLSSNGGRVLCFYLLRLTKSGADHWTLGFSYSDDDGATWTEGGRHLEGFSETQATIPLASFNRLRAVYHAGFITLCISATQSSNSKIWHLVSNDLGASFTEVEVVAQHRHRAELVVIPDTNQVIMIYGENSDGDLLYATKTSAFATFTDDPTFDTDLFQGAGMESDTAADFAAVIDDEGYLFVYWREATTSRHRIRIAMWDPNDLDQIVATKWLVSGGTFAYSNPVDTGGLDTTYLLDFCVTTYKGVLVMFANHSTQTATTGESLCRLLFGSYSSQDWTFQSFGYNNTSAFQAGYTYIPIELPGNLTAWTATGAGTEALSSAGLSLTTSTQIIDYNRTGSSSGNPCLVWATLKVTSGGNLASDDIAIQLRRADGALDYDVTLRFNTSQARLVDNNNAGATLGSDVSGLDNSNYYDWLISLEGTTVRTFYKLRSTGLWTAGPTGSPVDAGASSADNLVRWGHIASATASTKWKMFNSCIDGEANATNIAPGLTNPTDLQGRAFSTRELYLDGGTRIYSRGSSAYVGDAWDIATRYEFGAQNMDPQISPSPSQQWRSDADSVEEIIRWNPFGSAVLGRMLSSSIVVGVFNTNLATLVFEGSVNGSSWATLGMLDTRTGLTSLEFTRDATGSWVAPDTGTDHAGTRFVEMDELIDGTIVLDADNSSGNLSRHKIERNSEGVWRDDAGRHVELRIADPGDATETSGDCAIQAPDAVLVIHKVNTSYQAFRLRIPTQATADGDYRIGNVVICPLALFGWQYSWGRIVSEAANVETFQDDSGRRQKRQRGKNRRSAEFAWTEPRSYCDVFDDDPDPLYIQARDDSAYRGIAVREDGSLLRGILRRSNGGTLAGIYLPKIDPATVGDDYFVYVGFAKQLYGRVASEVTTSTTVVGDEATNECVTHGSLLFEGEV